MEAVKFFGIVFRSAEHMHWFIITMGMLGLSIPGAVICVLTKFYIGPTIIWGYFSVLELMISLSALFKTEYGTINGPVWSADCIWYNALLASIYLSAAAVYFFAYCFFSKHGRHATE